MCYFHMATFSWEAASLSACLADPARIAAAFKLADTGASCPDRPSDGAVGPSKEETARPTPTNNNNPTIHSNV